MKIDIVNFSGCAVVVEEKPQTGTVELRPQKFSNKMSDEEYHNAATVITLFPAIPQEELSVKEMYDNAIRSTAFDFLNDPEEDIYTLNDGEPI